MESEADKICTYIEKNTEPDDKIIVWGNWNIIYVESGRLPASKYSYQFPIIRIDEIAAVEFFNDINETRPKVVVLPKGRELEEMGDFLNMYEYLCVYQSAGNSIYMMND